MGDADTKEYRWLQGPPVLFRYRRDRAMVPDRASGRTGAATILLAPIPRTPAERPGMISAFDASWPYGEDTPPSPNETVSQGRQGSVSAPRDSTVVRAEVAERHEDLSRGAHREGYTSGGLWPIGPSAGRPYHP